MRVIRNEAGWDIALDLIFKDRDTAETIAARIQPVLHALLREAVDTSLRPRNVAQSSSAETITIRVPLANLSASSAPQDKGAEHEPSSGLTTSGPV
jgi:hypothetical protein